MDDDKLIYECQGTKLYTNLMTDNLTKHAMNEDLNGISLSKWKVFLLKYPNGYQEYVLYNDKGIPIGNSQRAEDIACKIDIYKANLHFGKEENYE